MFYLLCVLLYIKSNYQRCGPVKLITFKHPIHAFFGLTTFEFRIMYIVQYVKLTCC